MMGGDVSVQSNPGKGSTFRFLAWFGKSERKQSERIVQATLSEKKVLIVVDNRNTLILLKHIMKSAGMRVVQLQRAQEVLPALRSAFEADDPFDLCILDIQMHCVSGYDIAGEIRHPNSGIPYVALLAFSCSTEGDDTKRCMEAGFDGFLHKPIDRKTLLNRVKKLLVQQKQPGRKEQAIVAEHTIREDVKHSVRILMAEDNPVNQKLTKMMLNKAGYQVDVANNFEKQ